MVNDRQELRARTRAAFDRWEKLLAGESEEGIMARRLAGSRSIKDLIAHLRAWQQISIARLEAAVLDTTPAFPAWLAGSDPFTAEDHADDFNARIHQLTQSQPWSVVHREWREGYLHLLDLAEAIPEEEMFDAERYPWLDGHALSAVLEGTCEHHREHLADLSPRPR
jgi:hypothetical protein